MDHGDGDGGHYAITYMIYIFWVNIIYYILAPKIAKLRKIKRKKKKNRRQLLVLLLQPFFPVYSLSFSLTHSSRSASNPFFNSLI